MRKALLLKRETIEYGGYSLVLRNDWAISTNFTLQNSKSTRSFSEIPKNLLDSFRCINIFYHDFTEILKAYFFMMGFKNFGENATRLNLFIQILSTNFETQYGYLRENFNEETITILAEMKRIKFQVSPSLHTMTKLMTFSLNFYLENKSDINFIPDLVMTIRKGVEHWLKGFIPEKHMILVILLFNAIFGIPASSV